MKINPKVSIIILNWNNLQDTTECLESVRKLGYKNFDITVVDNASTDGSPDQIQKLFPHVVLIRNNENLGYAGGNNVGIEYALSNKADYVWLLNNDAIVESNVLSNLVLEGEKESSTGLLSPIIYSYSNPDRIQYCGSFLDRHNFLLEHIKDMNEIKKIKENDSWLWGTALLIKRKVIERIGYLNENFFAYHEDAEYSLRSLDAGYSNIIVPTAKVFHKRDYEAQIENKSLPPHYFYYMTRNEYWLWKKNLKGLKQLLFTKHYITRIVRSIASYKKRRDEITIDPILDGVYSALSNVGGKQGQKGKMPKFLKRFIIAHPHFILNLLNGSLE